MRLRSKPERKAIGEAMKAARACWAAGNTMDVTLCLTALERARVRAGCAPGIFNTDQGSQFTSQPWTSRLAEMGAHQHGRARAVDGQRVH